MQQQRFHWYDNSTPVPNGCDMCDIQREADVNVNIMKAAL